MDSFWHMLYALERSVRVALLLGANSRPARPGLLALISLFMRHCSRLLVQYELHTPGLLPVPTRNTTKATFSLGEINTNRSTGYGVIWLELAYDDKPISQHHGQRHKSLPEGSPILFRSNLARGAAHPGNQVGLESLV